MIAMQVFDLSAVKPHEFIQYGLGCLEKLAEQGDQCAKEVREKMRIVVCLSGIIIPNYFIFMDNTKLVGGC